MQDIKNYNTFTKIDPVNKGWSSDKKYYIETAEGRRLLLRVADISECDRKRDTGTRKREMGQVLCPISCVYTLDFSNFACPFFGVHSRCRILGKYFFP